MQKVLEKILEELTELKEGQAVLKSGNSELKAIVDAICDRQEETDAKLDSMAMDTHKMHGDILAVKDQLKELKIDLEFTYQKTSRNELEINKLKNR
jgi:hypothetical protein